MGVSIIITTGTAIA